MEQIPLFKVQYFEQKLAVFLPFNWRTKTNSWLTYVLVKTTPVRLLTGKVNIPKKKFSCVLTAKWFLINSKTNNVFGLLLILTDSASIPSS